MRTREGNGWQAWGAGALCSKARRSPRCSYHHPCPGRAPHPPLMPRPARRSKLSHPYPSTPSCCHAHMHAEGSLNDAARLDGRRRSSLRLSQSTLPLPLPTHTVEPGLPALDAHVRPRSATGGTACKWLRRAGRVPGRVHSLPGADARAGAAAGHSEDQGASSSSSNINNNNNKLLVHFSEGDVAKLVRDRG